MPALAALIDTGPAGTLKGRAQENRAPAFCDPAHIARELQPEDPVHCFCPEQLAATARQTGEGFPGHVSYAVKANSAPHIIAGLLRAGIGTFDVASIEEMRAVRAHSASAVLHYHNPVKSRREITSAWHDYQVRRFAVDHPAELEKIIETVGGPAGLEIAVRFALPADGSAAHDFSGKFGASCGEAVRLLRAVAHARCKPVLTFHPGSQCILPQSYARHIAAAADIARRANVKLYRLNTGGGFPARYLHSAPFRLEDFFQEIRNTVAAEFPGGLRPAIECEPGRALVASSTSLLTRVKLVKHETGEVYINDGIYGGLLECCQESSLQPVCTILGGRESPAGPGADFIVYGPTCDPLDRLPGRLRFPASIKEGDYLIFAGTGAYGAATATRFNGYTSGAVAEVARL